MVHLNQNNFFWKIIIILIYLLAPFIVQNFKKLFQRIQSYEEAQFWGLMVHFPKWEFFFRKPINEPCFFHSWLPTCQKSKSNINLLVKYCWLKNLTGREPFLDITREPDFSQACSFRRMLMNHKNFHFTQILDKTNDIIFLKSPKTMFFGPFWPF